MFRRLIVRIVAKRYLRRAGYTEAQAKNIIDKLVK